MKDAKVENERIRKQKEEDDKRAALEAKVMNGFNDITIQVSWLLYNSWQTMIVIVKKHFSFQSIKHSLTYDKPIWGCNMLYPDPSVHLNNLEIAALISKNRLNELLR